MKNYKRSRKQARPFYSRCEVEKIFAENKSYRDLKTESMGLTQRTENMLKRFGFNYVGEIEDYIDRQNIRELKNVGKNTEKEIRNKIAVIKKYYKLAKIIKMYSDKSRGE